MGPDVDIGLDFHGAVQPPTALILMKALEPYNPWFYEEIIQALNIDIMAELARKTHIPIATGERIFTKWGFKDILEKRAAAILQPEKAFDSAVALVVDHHIFLQVSDFVTADDAAALTTMFEVPPVEVPKEAFLIGVAKTLISAAAVFDKDRLDDSAKKSATLERAKECLQPALDGSDKTLQAEAKQLAREIAKKSRR